MKPPGTLRLDTHGELTIELARLLDEPVDVTIRDALIASHWAAHPRYKFFKSLPADAKVLDVGAGRGGLHYWRTWGEPRREDIQISGVDKFAGEFQSLYHASQIVDLECGKLIFEDASFDGIVMSHVLEHLEGTSLLKAELARVLKPGGSIYIETPAPITLKLVPRELLIQRGVHSATFNFFDDRTHVRPWSPRELGALIEELGASVQEEGIVDGPFELTQSLLGYGIYFEDEEITTYALWRRSGWAAYAVGRNGS